MRRPPIRRRVDGNQREVVEALRRCGALVLPLTGIGNNVADLLVRYRGRLFLLEVKRPGEAPTDGQLAWLNDWGGTVVHDTSEALKAVGVVR